MVKRGEFTTDSAAPLSPLLILLELSPPPVKAVFMVLNCMGLNLITKGKDRTQRDMILIKC